MVLESGTGSITNCKTPEKSAVEESPEPLPLLLPIPLYPDDSIPVPFAVVLGMFSSGNRVRSHARNRNETKPLKFMFGTKRTLFNSSGWLCSSKAESSFTSPKSSHMFPPSVVNCHTPNSCSAWTTATPSSPGTSMSVACIRRLRTGSPVELKSSSEIRVISSGMACSTGASFTGFTVSVILT